MKNLIVSIIISILIFALAGCYSSQENTATGIDNLNSTAIQDNTSGIENETYLAPTATPEIDETNSIGEANPKTTQEESSETVSETSLPTTHAQEEDDASGSLYQVNFPETQGADASFEIEIASTITGLPDKAAVYQMVKPDITSEYVRELGDKLGLSGEIKPGTDVYSLSDNDTDAFLEVYLATGTVAYCYPSGQYPQKTPSLPTEEEAIKIATDFLSETGLLGEGYTVYRVVSSGSSGDIRTSLYVDFRSDIRTLGPGSKHGVRVGNGGEIVDIFYNPIDLKKLSVQEELPAKSLEQSLQDLKDNDKCYYQVAKGTKKVEIESVTLAYWLEPVYSEQEYIVPVYVFTGTCYDADGNTLEDKYTGYIKADN